MPDAWPACVIPRAPVTQRKVEGVEDAATDRRSPEIVFGVAERIEPVVELSREAAVTTAGRAVSAGA